MRARGRVPGTGGERTRAGHLGAVDVVRFVTVAGVVLVHATSLTISYGSAAGGAVLDIGHVTRSVFLLLSAFVLTYSFRRRPLGPWAFWRRRYPLVVAPYLAWSLIYVLTDSPPHSVASVVVSFLEDLPDGDAHFHLYFLLLTMQLYAVFPALMWVLRRRPGISKAAVVVGLLFQLVLTGALHYRFWPPAMAPWMDHAGTWLLSYTFYVTAGIAAAWHLDAVTAWIRRHSRMVAVAWTGAVAISLTSYVSDMSYLGFSPLRASEVFQPSVVAEAVTATVALYALGLWLVDRLPARFVARLERSSDVSFGVYLAHPLVLGVILDGAVATGVWRRLSGIPSGLGEALVALALVPAVYAITYAGVSVLRRSPFSMVLTGRSRSAAGSVASPAVGRSARRIPRSEGGGGVEPEIAEVEIRLIAANSQSAEVPTLLPHPGQQTANP